MRITQCHTVLRFFKPSVFKKYGFKEYTDVTKSTVLWGCYPAQQRKVISHKAFMIIVWCGGDALALHKYPSFVQFLRQNTGRIKHIAISNFIEQDLVREGLPFKSIPLTSMNMSIGVRPRGSSLYVYGGMKGAEMYQVNLCKEIARNAGIPIIVAYKDTYPRSVLVNQIYRSCFLGLRLLNHDGLSNSIVELGLMGRMVVTNSHTPNAIPFTDAKSILQIVQREYENRKQDNSRIAEDMRNFINVGTDWLNSEYWTN